MREHHVVPLSSCDGVAHNVAIMSYPRTQLAFRLMDRERNTKDLGLHSLQSNLLPGSLSLGSFVPSFCTPQGHDLLVLCSVIHLGPVGLSTSILQVH